MIRYRTLIGELGLALILLAGLWVCGKYPAVVPAYISFALGVGGLGAFLAGKSLGEHATQGTGIGSALKALWTPATPAVIATQAAAPAPDQAPPPAPGDKPPEGAV